MLMDSNDIEQFDARLRQALSADLPDAAAVLSAVRGKIRRQRAVSLLLMGTAAAIFIAGIAYAAAGHAHRSRVYEELARDHHREVVNHEPRHWKTSPTEIAVLAARFGLSESTAESLAPLGYSLEHAKTCGMDGKPVLHLVYTNGSGEISIYIRRGTGTNLSGSATANLEQVSAFRTAGFEAAIVMDGTPRECLEFARMAARIL
jgi:hypothetical protein